MHTLESDKALIVNDRSISSEVQAMHLGVEENNSEVMTLDQSNLVVTDPLIEIRMPHTKKENKTYKIIKKP